jgi:hypothetical protein
MITDAYGRKWDIPKNERCRVCGQPDSCGDCNHNPLSEKEVLYLGGKITKEKTKKWDPMKKSFNGETRWGFVSKKYSGLLKGPEWEEPILYKTKKAAMEELKDIEASDEVVVKVELTYYSPF